MKDTTVLTVKDLIEKQQTYYHSLSKLTAMEQNIGCIDGKIIGTGRADYTQGSTAYNLFVNDRTFALIDIPGIEGNEEKYREIIKDSLAKAHVIFYVNGSGKMIEEDSLKKIKEYMHDGTSVYAVFNVHLKGKKERIPGIDQTYQEELSAAYQKTTVMIETEKELRSFLGDNFKGSVSLNGLLSFCSLAMDSQGNTTIVNEESKYLRADQAKFVQEYSGDLAAMRLDSHVSDIQNVITDKVDHFDEYIQEENLKKLKSRLADMLSDMQKLKKEEAVKVQDFNKDYDSFESNCENARDAFIRSVGLIGRNVVEPAFHPVRDAIFTEIENTGGKMKSEDAERILNRHKDQILQDIQAGIDAKINAASKVYQEDVQEAEKRLLRDMQRSQKKFDIAMGSSELRFDTSFIKALKITGKDLRQGALKILSYGYSGLKIGSVIPVLGNVVGAVLGFLVGIFVVIKNIFTSRETRINKAKSKFNESLEKQIDSISNSIRDKMKDMGIEEKIKHNHNLIKKSIEIQRKSMAEIERIMDVVEQELKDSYQKI